MPYTTIDKAIAWRIAALADGWSNEPTYQHEAIDRASTLRKDGFIAQIIARPEDKVFKPIGSIAIWGPDGLAIDIDNEYNWDKIQANLRLCMDCKRGDVETQRVGFAGRVCVECLPAARKRDEYAGWSD